MRVLAVSGSPRQGGNSDTAARSLLATLGADHDTSFVRIADHAIKPCVGCWSCRAGDACSITGDDFDLLIRRIADAELVFFCEPVYWHAPPGIVKNAMDRSVRFSFTQPDLFKGQKFALVTISEESGWEQHDWFPTTWFRHFGGAVVGSIALRATHRGDLARDEGQLAALRAFARDILSVARPA